MKIKNITKPEIYVANKDKVDEFIKKLEMVRGLNSSVVPYCGGIKEVSYDVFMNEQYSYFQEFLKVTFKGDAYCVRNCNCNSCSAIIEELGKLIYGGYYDEVEYYNKCTEDENLVKLVL